MKTITLEQYFIGREHSSEQELLASDLLEKVNYLLERFELQTNMAVKIHTHTNTNIGPAGSDGFDSVGGIHEGGFRFPDCPQGAKSSSHKILDDKGAGIDIYDPDNTIDKWVNDDILTEFGLYREAPISTPGWCHLTNRAPPSGHRTFIP